MYHSMCARAHDVVANPYLGFAEIHFERKITKIKQQFRLELIK